MCADVLNLYAATPLKPSLSLLCPQLYLVSSLQIRAVAGADYVDDAFTPPGGDRPTARQVRLYSSWTVTRSARTAVSFVKVYSHVCNMFYCS